MVTGDALKGFWSSAVAIPETGKAAITFDWYRSFLQYMLDAQAYTWFAKLVAYGEMPSASLLIIGAFTGIAAFFGGFMNWNFMMAGSASTNPLLFVSAVGPDPGLEGLRLLRRGLLPAALDRHPLAREASHRRKRAAGRRPSPRLTPHNLIFAASDRPLALLAACRCFF